MKGPSFSRLSIRPISLSWAIGLFLFSIYLLSFSGEFHVMDELAVFSAGYNLAQHGRADIDQLIWTNHWTPNPPGVWGQDGHLYTKKPPGISFITAPLIGLGRAIPGFNSVHVGLLTNALITALTAALLCLWLADMGFSRPAAALASLGYGLGTVAWVYARMFWESSLLALAFLVALWSLHRAVHMTSRRPLWLLVCGLAVAVGLTLRFESVLIVALIGLYLAVNQASSIKYQVSGITHSPRGTYPQRGPAGGQDDDTREKDEHWRIITRAVQTILL
jgi:4-amino-4-deoxy-L-arabinose transferase-like glycosyltransferase